MCGIDSCHLYFIDLNIQYLVSLKDWGAPTEGLRGGTTCTHEMENTPNHEKYQLEEIWFPSL